MERPPTARRVWLVRHAESTRLGSPWAMDADLTPRGEAQLDLLRQRAASMAVDSVVCSELVRARRTAEAIGSVHGLVPDVDPGWNEFHTVGDWREHSATAVDALVGARFYRPDDRSEIGESLRDLHRRTIAAWERLLASPGRDLLLVTHNAVLGTLLQAVLGLREDQERSSMISYPHAAISELWLVDRDHDPALPGRITVVMRVADVGHLPPELVTR